MIGTAYQRVIWVVAGLRYQYRGLFGGPVVFQAGARGTISRVPGVVVNVGGTWGWRRWLTFVAAMLERTA